ncbi:MAG: DUF3576 domain-containing protein [Alphaproteobacteria bacterium]|nr:DUF3576 domain-containing protein [Alphaproteobacteria bacterium]
MNTFKNKAHSVIFAGALFFVSSCLLTGCDTIKTEAKYPENRDGKQYDSDIYEKQAGIFSSDGGILGNRKKNEGASAIGVNSFLWRATLDTVSFMPLASADPFGGVILTDWYTDTQKPNERIKINAFVMGRELRADGIRVRTFRQVKKGNTWNDAQNSEETARKLEDAVLSRARELRIAHLAK